MSPQSALTIRSVPIDQVLPAVANARRRTPRNLAAIEQSLLRFGQQRPVVVGPDGRILAGNGTWAAAKALGWEQIAIVDSSLAGPEATAYAIADNRTAELAEWDDEILVAQLAELSAADQALAAATGFSPAEIDRFVAELHAQTDPPDVDAAPDPPAAAASRPGAIYQLGRHRLLCGDATDPAGMARLIRGDQVRLLLTDPPYNVAYEGKTADALRIANDALSPAQFAAFLNLAFSAANQALAPGAAFYIWHADSGGETFRAACRQAGWPVRQCLIWAKNAAVIGRQDYHWQHEPCLYGWKPGAAHQWFGGRRPTTLQRSPLAKHLTRTADGWILLLDDETYLLRGDNLTVAHTETTLIECPRPTANRDHPTMKPVALYERLIVNSTRREQVLLDPFAGSGTAAIAAQRTGRLARLVELDPRYCDVIRRRWAELVHGLEADWEALTPMIDAPDESAAAAGRSASVAPAADPAGSDRQDGAVVGFGDAAGRDPRGPGEAGPGGT